MPSKRKYPQVECPQCHELFHPHDARQVFCKLQCRVDFNNDKRKRADAPFLENKKRIKANDKVLEKAYNTLKKHQQTTISGDMLAVAGYDFQFYLESHKNTKTGKPVFWNVNYGIEPAEQQRKLFFIHKK